MLNALIAADADFSIQSDDDDLVKQTPLHIAARNGNKDAVIKLLESDIIINKRKILDVQDLYGYTAAHILIEKSCSEDMIDALIAAEINFNISNKAGKTVFQLILDKKVSIQILRKLIDAGADSKAQDKDGNIAEDRLKEAEEKERLEAERLKPIKAEFISVVNNKDLKNVLKFLEENKEDKKAIINAEDKNGRTAAHILMINKCSDDVIDALIKAEADFSIQDDSYYKQTPLHIMAENGKEDAVIKLLESDIIINKRKMLDAQDKGDNTAAHYLIENKCSDDVLNALIKAEADFSIKGRLEQTPLHIMAKNGNKDAVIKLLGSDIINKSILDVKDSYGYTAAHYLMINKCSDDVLNALIKAEADFSIQDNSFYKRTPLHIAARKWKQRCCYKTFRI